MNHDIARLADRLHELAARPLPHGAEEAARRTLLNVLGTSTGASSEAAVDIVVDTLGRLAAGDPTPARAPGRVETLTPLDAALCTGIAAHLDDFDDTHLRTVIHPGAVCLAALVALQHDVATFDRDRVLTAVAWGVEVQLRLGNAISPEHYDAGWHITGTCGAVGAAVTAGLLLGLPPRQLAIAVALAAERGIGNREGFGSMTKPFHPGRAAVNGVLAARDAATGADDPGDTLLGPHGLSTRLARGVLRSEELLEDLGVRWELETNTFKPYPCGIVSHPAIEVAEGLHKELAAAGGLSAVSAIRLHCHPLVPELTGDLAPSDGLRARFSTAHGVAAGLVTGSVDLRSYEDSFVTSEPVGRARSLVELLASDTVERDAARLEVDLDDGTTLKSEVAHARGSLLAPLDDEELHAKVAGLVDRVTQGGADALARATSADGPGYLEGLLDATRPRAERAGGRPEAPSTSGALDGDGLDAEVARAVAEGRQSQPAGRTATTHLATLVARARDAVATGEADPRARARRAARALLDAGVPPLEAAAAAGRAATDGATSDDEAHVGTALAWTRDLAVRLGVDDEAVTLLAATLGHLAGRADPQRVLWALGLAATQTTGVSGDDPAPGVRALRLERAVSAGVEAAMLGRAGFTGPPRPLTGRRGLLSLLAVE